MRALRLFMFLVLAGVEARAAGTQVVLLGTGSPPADPDRSGPTSPVIVNGTPYLIDMGAGVATCWCMKC